VSTVSLISPPEGGVCCPAPQHSAAPGSFAFSLACHIYVATGGSNQVYTRPTIYLPDGTVLSVCPTALAYDPKGILYAVDSLSNRVLVFNTGEGIKTARRFQELLWVSRISSIAASSNFAVSSTTCGTSLGALARCVISVTFDPKTSGTFSGTLSVNDSADNTPQTASLNGTGRIIVTLAPASLTFPIQLVGSAPPPMDLTLTNHANVNLPITSIATSGDLVVSSTTCGTSLGPLGLGKCAISVTFKPKSVGTFSGTLTVDDSADNTPQTTSLNGTATSITVSPAALAFGNQLVGTTSGMKSATFSNKGASLIFNSNITASGDFAASSTTCGSSLASGASCSVMVTFTPTATGARTGALMINTTAPVPVVALSGTGILLYLGIAGRE
jgi:hypothetical protein